MLSLNLAKSKHFIKYATTNNCNLYKETKPTFHLVRFAVAITLVFSRNHSNNTRIKKKILFIYNTIM